MPSCKKSNKKPSEQSAGGLEEITQGKPNKPSAGKVLILENDYSNRVLFADYLEQCGYLVYQLADERQVFELLSSYQPDVLMLNLKLPMLDGFSVIEQIRGNSKWSKLSILVVSGYSSIRDRQKAYHLGANAYLVKPILPADLSASVAHLIQQAK